MFPFPLSGVHCDRVAFCVCAAWIERIMFSPLNAAFSFSVNACDIFVVMVPSLQILCLSGYFLLQHKILDLLFKWFSYL